METEGKTTVVKRAVTVLVVLMMTLSVVAVGGVGAQETTSDSTEDDDVEPADEAYITDDGEVVLVYTESQAGSNVREAEFGADVAIGLVHGFLEVDENTSELEGALSLVAEQNRVEGNGDVAVARPAAVEDLEVDAQLTQTTEESSFDGSLSLAFPTGEGTTPASHASSGTAVVGADEFQLDATYNETLGGNATNPDPGAISIVLEGTETGHTMTVEEERLVDPANNASWDTPEAAETTLSAQFESLAGEVNGSAEVTLDAHDYVETESDDELSLKYTVDFTGVQDGVAETVVADLESQEGLNMTDAERQSLVNAIADVEIERIAFDTTTTETDTDVAVSAHVRNYEASMLTALEFAADRSDDLLTEGDVDEVRTVMEARAAADLTQTVAWDANVTVGQDTTKIDVETGYDSENWSAYVDELEDRGVTHPGNVSAQLTATSAGEEIDVDAAFTVERDDLVNDTINAVREVLGAEGGAESEELVELLDALERSGFEVARTDVDLADDTVSIEAGAKFDNVSELEAVTRDAFGDVPMAHVYAEGNASGSASYVYLSDEANASESWLMDEGLIDDNTTVHESADLSELPEMDRQGAADYLGIDLATPTPTETETDTTDDVVPIDEGQPGFGAVVALLAILLVVVRARRD